MGERVGIIELMDIRNIRVGVLGSFGVGDMVNRKSESFGEIIKGMEFEFFEFVMLWLGGV